VEYFELIVSIILIILGIFILVTSLGAFVAVIARLMPTLYAAALVAFLISAAVFSFLQARHPYIYLLLNVIPLTGGYVIMDKFLDTKGLVGNNLNLKAFLLILLTQKNVDKYLNPSVTALQKPKE
jgi:ABC-type multidrug transport system permease subunit